MTARAPVRQARPHGRSGRVADLDLVLATVRVGAATGIVLVIFAVSMVMVVALTLLVNRTRVGKGLRAVAEDVTTATLLGNGTVLAVEGAGDKTVAKVKFDVGEKRLLLRYAPVEKI